MAYNEQTGRPRENPPQVPPGGFMRRGFGTGGMHRAAPVEKPQNAWGTIKRIYSYLGKEKVLFFLVFLLVIIASLITLFTPKLLANAIDDIDKIKANNMGYVNIIIFSLLFMYTLDAALSFVQNFLMARISQKITLTLRKSLFHKLQNLPLVFFDTTANGDIMSRFSNDIDNISQTISGSATMLMGSIINIGGTFILMIILSPRLTIAAIVSVPIVFFLTNFITKRTRKLYLTQQKNLGQMGGFIEETITGIDIVNAFGRQKENIEEFEKISDEFCQVGVKTQIYAGFLMPLMNVINNLSFALIAFYGSYLAINGEISVGLILGFLVYSRQFSRPLNEIANIYNTILSSIAGAERFFEIIDTKEEEKDAENAFELSFAPVDVEFKNVYFSYKKGVHVLKDVSFYVPKGSSIAFVGPTGAGKTTIVNLLTRFYDIESGSILIDGRDIKSYSRKSLRSVFGVVLQDTYLFNGTVYENIGYGNLKKSKEDIIDSAKVTGAHDFIAALPKGYDTVLSESGNNLSQGQRQQLSIARAVLAERPILILDEATSSVDTRTEKTIQEAMLRLMENKTTFIIAHRLATIKEANNIIVIYEGCKKEFGNHKVLMGFDGIYAKMYRAQLYGESILA